MKKFMAIGVALFAFAAIDTAGAADMLVKVPASVASYNWTGWYMGLNAGGAWGVSDTSPNLPAGFAPAVVATATAKLSGSGFTGGGQFGYNWQFNNVVTGLEADINYTDLNTTRSALVPGFINQVDQSFKSDWLTTFRGRLGLAWDQTLVYATGGLAVADIRLMESTGFGTVTASRSGTRAGYAIGGGAEWGFAQGWTVKAEYLRVDLGTVNNIVNTLGFPPTDFYANRVTENIARLGLNRRF